MTETCPPSWKRNYIVPECQPHEGKTGVNQLIAEVINLRALPGSIHAGKTQQDVRAGFWLGLLNRRWIQ